MGEEWVLTRSGLKRVSSKQQGEIELQAQSQRKRKREENAPEQETNHATQNFDFRSIRREVQDYGARNLGKKDQQSYQKRAYELMGIQLQSGPRVGAKIGVGMAKKNKEREQRAEQELIDSGMMSVKGKGKKKAAERKANLDRGLDEAKGFTPGLMKVKAPIKSRGPKGASGLLFKGGGGRGRGRGRDSGSSGRGRQGGRGPGRR